MFFTSQILLLITFATLYVDNRAVYSKYNVKESRFVRQATRYWEIGDHLEQLTNTSNSLEMPLFQMILNLTEAPNLKSNIYDKILSEEILSDKHQLHEKYIKFSSVAHVTTNTVATPILGVKQKWHMLHTKIKNALAQDGSSDIDSKNNDKDKQDEKSNGKVLRLRSLGIGPHDAPLYTNNSNKKCTCLKKISATCTHRSVKLCTQGETTPDIALYSTAFYVTYQPFYLGISEVPEKNYYHPNVISQFKLTRRKKNRKTTKIPVGGNIYYDSYDYNDYRTKYQYLADIDYYKMQDLPSDEEKKKHNRQKHKQIINDHKDCSNNSTMENQHINKFISELVSDLKKYYSDSVIKDCYCAFMSSGWRFKSWRYSFYVIWTFTLLGNVV